MSAEVTIRIPPRRGARRRGAAVGATVVAGAPDAPPSPPPERIPRVARVLALAHHWRALIQSGAVRDQADLARLVGVSRARVTQVMRLLHLAPDIQEAVLDGAVDGPSAEVALRKTAEHVSWVRQRRRRIREHGGMATWQSLTRPTPPTPFLVPSMGTHMRKILVSPTGV